MVLLLLRLALTTAQNLLLPPLTGPSYAKDPVGNLLFIAVGPSGREIPWFLASLKRNNNYKEVKGPQPGRNKRHAVVGGMRPEPTPLVPGVGRTGQH